MDLSCSFGKILSMRFIASALLPIIIGLAACTPSSGIPVTYPTYDPFVPIVESPSDLLVDATIEPIPTSTDIVPTPTRAPLSLTLPPSPDPNMPIFTPTADTSRELPTPRLDNLQYVVQAGDTIGSIAQNYGISADELMRANGVTDPNTLEIGAILNIPPPNPGLPGPSFKIIPDSELVYGPASAQFDINQFIISRAGYLANYTEQVNGELLTADKVIKRVAQNYSINPRLLLALLEYQSGWVTNPDPENIEFPLELIDSYHTGLYLQLTWAADTLNRGYYLWRANALRDWVLLDGSVVPIDPTINAGTAAVQNLFAHLAGREPWEASIRETGFFLTYWFLFGNPFNLAVEPLLPESLEQPLMSLPFDSSETWSFTGGPHGGWDTGSAWAALDFAPPGDTASCLASGSWVTAVSDGVIVRALNGAVIQDLDNDGYEQTGWVVLYMHIDTSDRVVPGTYLFGGEHIGHPSCEGGISNGTHMHLARRYNGEWIPADGSLPFNLDGWISSGNGTEYDGFLTRDSETVEAWDGVNSLNQITR